MFKYFTLYSNFWRKTLSAVQFLYTWQGVLQCTIWSLSFSSVLKNLEQTLMLSIFVLKDSDPEWPKNLAVFYVFIATQTHLKRTQLLMMV